MYHIIAAVACEMHHFLLPQLSVKYTVFSCHNCLQNAP
jgi:hypothetical protein